MSLIWTILSPYTQYELKVCFPYYSSNPASVLKQDSSAHKLLHKISDFSTNSKHAFYLINMTFTNSAMKNNNNSNLWESVLTTLGASGLDPYIHWSYA